MREANDNASDLHVGRFSLWLNQFVSSLEGKNDANVPCNKCVACCTSSYFIHIKPTDKESLRHIPKPLLFPAPGLPKGNFLLGYNEKGHCPLFQNEKCSIYDYRPETCRQYDCRVYPATGLSLENEEKPLISFQAQRWHFETSSAIDLDAFEAVQMAAEFIVKYAGYFPNGFIPNSTPQKAIMAIRIHELFTGLDKNEISEQVDELTNSIRRLL